MTLRGEVTHAHHARIARPLRSGAVNALIVAGIGGWFFAVSVAKLRERFEAASADAALAVTQTRLLYAVGELDLLTSSLSIVAALTLAGVIGLLVLLTLTVLAGRWGAASATSAFAHGVNAGPVSFTVGADILTVRHDRAVRRCRWRDLLAVRDLGTCSLLVFPGGSVLVPARADAQEWRPLFEAAGRAPEATGDAPLEKATAAAERSIATVQTPYDHAIFVRHVMRNRDPLTAAIGRLSAPQAPYLLFGVVGTLSLSAGLSNPFVIAWLLVLVGANWTRFFGRHALDQAWGLSEFERYDRQEELIVTKKGLVTRSRSEWAFYAWSAFSHVASSRDGLYLHMAPGMAVLLPSHALSSAKEQDEWLTLLEARLAGLANDAALGAVPRASARGAAPSGPWGRAAA